MVKVFVPATIGNVGPGFDVLGLVFPGLGDVIAVDLIDGPSTVASVTGRDANLVPLDPKKNCAVIAAESMLKINGINRGVRVTIDKQLPISGGLGASAASSVGGALAAAFACGISPKQDEILSAALEGEEAVAGRHLDNIAPCLLGGLTVVLSLNPPRVYRLPMTADWWLSILTPNARLETRTAREVLPKEIAVSDWVSAMANSIGLVSAFNQGDANLARICLVDRFAEPRRAPLIPRFGAIRDAAINAGALGCSISGAGPTIFALSEDEETARACQKAMEKAYAGVPSLSLSGQCTGNGAYKL